MIGKKRIQPNYEIINKFTKEPNTKCPFCGRPFYVKPYRLKRSKNVYCSQECHIEHKKVLFSGKGNHQYGLKGNKNSSWKSDERISNYGYKMIRVLEHPFRNSDDMVFEHRLLAEKYLLTKENSVVVNGKAYLSKEYDVHHKDFNKLNNSLDNLLVLKKTSHRRLHVMLRKIMRSSDGRFLKTIKATDYMDLDEILRFTNDFIKKEPI